MNTSAIPAVHLDAVSRAYRQERAGLLRPGATVPALRGVTLTIPAGARFGIVGESGSGKTTLVRLIAGLDRPSSGRITVHGTTVRPSKKRRRAERRGVVQMVFQDPAASLNPRLKVHKIVAEPLRAAKKDNVPAAVRAALDAVGLGPELDDRYPHQLSGGQRQRVAIARAIAPEPAVLIADEAVSALDATARNQTLELIESLVEQRNMTLIFVSHDLSVVRQVCDTVAVLHDGEVVEVGPTEQVLESPQSEYARSLVAVIPTLARSLKAADRRAAKRSS